MGPFETSREASQDPAARQAYEVMADSFTPGTGAAATSKIILDACERAGVELGAFDRQIVTWLGNWEPETAAVIAGMIARAASGRGPVLPAPADAADARAQALAGVDELLQTYAPGDTLAVGVERMTEEQAMADLLGDLAGFVSGVNGTVEMTDTLTVKLVRSRPLRLNHVQVRP